MKCFKRPWSRREEPGNILEATHGSAMEKHVIEVLFVPNKLQVHYPMGHLAPEGVLTAATSCMVEGLLEYEARRV